MSSISLLTQAKALVDANKVAASPPQEGGLRVQSHSAPRLKPCVTRIKFPLHHLEEVACELNLASYPGWGLW